MSGTAVVVGGTGGIGAPIVSAFAGLGWNVAVVTRGRKPLDFHGNDRSVTVFTGDVSKQDDMQRIGREFSTVHGRADCLIYASGIPPDVTVGLREYAVENWDATFNTYVRGFLLSFQTMLPNMNRDGHIVALGSAITRFSSDCLPPIQAGHYAAAKAALAELVKWARREAREREVKVSLVSPGAVDTAVHRSGELASISKKLLPVKVVCDAVLCLVSHGVEADLQMVL